MIEATRLEQDAIQESHRERGLGAAVEGAEPLYGLAPHPGHGASEAPIEESAEDEAAAEGQPVAEASTNMTWAIVLGGILLLFIVGAILIFGVGATYSAAIISQYPVH